MPRVSLCLPDKSSTMLHQSFSHLGRVRYFTFDENPDEHSDFVITFGVVPENTLSWWHLIPKSRKIGVLMENPRIYFPSDEYLENHGLIISPVAKSGIATEWYLSHSGVPWFYGRDFHTDSGLSHQTIANRKAPDLGFHAERQPLRKHKRLSIITSSKTSLIGHKLRFQTALELSQGNGPFQVDVFGFGHRPIQTKDTGIDPYAYTVVIENDFIGNYVTEKICDALLGFSQPIYIGAPNVQDYFPSKLIVLQPDEPSILSKKIIEITDNPPDLNGILINRNSVLYKMNILYHVAEIIHSRIA